MRIPAIPHEPRRRASRALLLLAAFAALLVTAGPAAAADSCGRKVIDDWWDGRIDGTYELRCYDEAIKILPRDVRDYSSAEEDIKRALTNARRGKPAPPNQSGATETPTTPPEDPVDTTETTETTSAPPTGRDDPPTDTIATPPVETESASSVPIPLLVLAGLALLLVLGGSAGYVVRRIQARRAPPSAA